MQELFKQMWEKFPKEGFQIYNGFAKQIQFDGEKIYLVFFTDEQKYYLFSEKKIFGYLNGII